MREVLTSRIVFLLASLWALIMFGTVTFYVLEDWTWAQAFYFSVVSVTTVGYGDLAPTTDVSRVVTALYILVGVAVAVAALGAIGSRYLKLRDDAMGKKLYKVKHDIIQHEDEIIND